LLEEEEEEEEEEDPRTGGPHLLEEEKDGWRKDATLGGRGEVILRGHHLLV